jgi:SAM-dependent methyltransferase
LETLDIRQRKSRWFEVFKDTTNQKEREGEALGALIRGWTDETRFSPETAVDFGCGTGEITKALVDAVGRNDGFSLTCIDRDPRFLRMTHEKIAGTTEAVMIEGDAFGEDVLRRLPRTIDLALFNHVMYYAGMRFDRYLADILRRIPERGVAVFGHGTPDSDLNALRQDNDSSFVAFTTHLIGYAVLSSGLALAEGTILSDLPFEDRKDAFLRLRRKALPPYDPDDSVRNLLEFIARKPLESFPPAQLRAFLDAAEGKLAEQNGMLRIKTKIQLALGAGLADAEERAKRLTVALPHAERPNRAPPSETMKKRTEFIS